MNTKISTAGNEHCANRTRGFATKTAHKKNSRRVSKEEREYQRKLRDAYRLGPWRQKSIEERWAELRGHATKPYVAPQTEVALPSPDPDQQLELPIGGS